MTMFSHVLIPTDDADGGWAERVRRAGAEFATRNGARVLLYDRSTESYLVDPYPSGPWTAESSGPDGGSLLEPPELARMGRGYLVRQLRALTDQGVDARAWLPRRPGAATMRGCVDRFGVDLVLLPEELERPSLLDRVRGNTLEKFRDALAVPVGLVLANGHISEPALAR